MATSESLHALLLEVKAKLEDMAEKFKTGLVTTCTTEKKEETALEREKESLERDKERWRVDEQGVSRMIASLERKLPVEKQIKKVEEASHRDKR